MVCEHDAAIDPTYGRVGLVYYGKEYLLDTDYYLPY